MSASLFGKGFKTGVKVSTRKDDEDGTFWQKIDSIREEGTDPGETPRVGIYKTTVRVVREGAGSQSVGDQTTQAHFPDSKYPYFEREMKQLLGTGLNLSVQDRNKLEGQDGIRTDDGEWEPAPKGTTEKSKLPKGRTFEPGIGTLLVDMGILNGAVLEMKCVKMPKAKDPTEFFTRVTPIRRVTQAELEESLTPEQISEFFPEGLPEDVA